MQHQRSHHHTSGRHRVARRGAAALTAGIVLAASSVTGAGAAEPAPPATTGATVVAEGLSSPRGLDSFLGVPIVSQGAFGAPGPVVAALRLPWAPTPLQPVSQAAGLVDVAVAGDGAVWGLSDGKVVRKSPVSTRFTQVADIVAYQVSDPDPTNTEGEPTESNPYGIAVLPNGDALVADAAGNDLLRVTRTGQVSTLARFGPEMVSTDHLGDPELPPALPAESVPTSIAVTKDAIYVGELKGFPFRPGSSHVWRIGLRANGAACDVATTAAPSNSNCTIARSGFTGIQDIDLDGPGRMYVLEIAEDGVLAFEAGFETGVFPPAVLQRVARDGSRTELAAGQLSQGGGVDVGLFGTVHVTDGVFGNGRLLRIGR